MSARGSPLWAIETETDGAEDEPRSLWDRVEANLRRQEVFTIRRVIGEAVLDRNEGLWREVDALEDILRETQDQNEELSKKVVARSPMPQGLERTLLETHLRLLLGKLGVQPGGGAEDGNGFATLAGSGGERGTSGLPRPHTFRDDELGRTSDRPCRCNRAGSGCPMNSTSSSHGKHRSSSGAPSSPLVPLETQQDRAVYDYISAGGSSTSGRPHDAGCGVAGGTRGGAKDEGGGEYAQGGVVGLAEATGRRLTRVGGSRPETGRRPGTSRSARSAPECLESGRCLTVATIDTALGELRAAFEEEAENLLEEVADLTHLLEDEAGRKANAERRSRRDLPGRYTSGNGDSGAAGEPVPSSELRRYGKKLEEAVRSREHAVGVAERLSLPRRTAGPAVGPVEYGRRSGRGGGPGPPGRGGDGGRKGATKGRRPSGGATFLELEPSKSFGFPSPSPPRSPPPPPQQQQQQQRKLRKPSDRLGSLSNLEHRRRGGCVGLEREKTPSSRYAPAVGVRDDDDGGVIEGTRTARPVRAEGGRREVLAAKLRGAVRDSREEEALDDERFLS